MTLSGPYGWVFGLVLDPRFGLPILLLAEVTSFWFAWNLRTPPPLGARRPSWSAPEGDAVSRMYYALREERFSTLMRWSRERIEELYEARAGGPLPSLPWTLRAPATDPTDRYRLRRLTLDLGAFEWEARERETGLHLRWAFWRSRSRDRALYRSRVDALLGRAQSAIALLEGSAS